MMLLKVLYDFMKKANNLVFNCIAVLFLLNKVTSELLLSFCVTTSPCLSHSCSPVPGVSGGAGAAHGPSAQYVQAGAERRRCNSGETLEVLWV